MRNVLVNVNGREYSAVETRNITAGDKVRGEYEKFKIKVKHNGIMSKFTVKPLCFWDNPLFAGSFIYDIEKDKITWFLWSEYDPKFIFIFVKIAGVLDDEDVVLVSVKRGRMIDRFRIKISELRRYIGLGDDKFGRYPILKEVFEKLQPKIYRGGYAKRF